MSLMAKSFLTIIKKVCLLIIFFNVIYLISSYIYYAGEGFGVEIFNKQQELIESLNIDFDSNDPNAEISTTNIDYQNQIELLLRDVANNANNEYWLTNTDLTNTEIEINPNHFLNETDSIEAWKNKNEIFYDPRLTMSLYINYLKNKFIENNDSDMTDLEVPFDWIDWIDFSLFNNDLAKPVKDRKSCHWIKQFSEIPTNAENHVFQCIDNQELSPNAIKKLGFDRHEQLPGFIQTDHAEQRATNRIRVSQGKSYILTHMPNPYKLIFLNKEGGTYEVQISQERNRITKSGLMNEYILNNYPEANQNKLTNYLKQSLLSPKLNLDPTKEFTSLKQRIKPLHVFESNNIDQIDPFNMYRSLHSDDINTNKSLPLPPDAFRYSDSLIDQQITLYKRLEGQRKLSANEQGFLESLELSKYYDTFTEPTYFKQSTLILGKDPKNRGDDRGYHYDWRFFNGGLNYQVKGWTSKELNTRTTIILDRLLRNWFRFTQEKGIVSWIMHGPLLSWYWNANMFPFDNDLDVQMPIKELVRLGELYNQTLVVEDVNEGYGKFLIDVGTYVHNRDISRHANHIDARFIDVDTGIYIDITGLSNSDAPVPAEFYNSGLFDIKKDFNEEIYNDRRKHFYKVDQLSPLRYTMLGGVPVHIPNKLSERLKFEYPKGLTRPEFANWFFVPKLGLWLRQDQLTKVLDENDYRIVVGENKEIKFDNEKIINLVIDMTDEEIYKLLKTDQAILSEYYLTRGYTEFHKKENEFIFKRIHDEEKKTTEVLDNDELITNPELAKQYMQFINSNVNYGKPLRKPLFLYEKIEQPKYHDDNELFSPYDEVFRQVSKEPKPN